MLQALGTIRIRFLQKKSKKKFHACVPLSVLVHGEDGEFMLVCGIRNRLRIHRVCKPRRIREKYLYTYEKYVKRLHINWDEQINHITLLPL